MDGEAVNWKAPRFRDMGWRECRALVDWMDANLTAEDIDDQIAWEAADVLMTYEWGAKVQKELIRSEQLQWALAVERIRDLSGICECIMENNGWGPSSQQPTG